MKNNNDIKETAEEVFGEGEGMDLGEAPVSITIRAYYKGFSVLITKRKQRMSEGELDNISQAIDNMIDKGFNPSWNKETNKTNGDEKPETREYGDCEKCGAERVKNPKTGKIFCSKKCWL